MNRRQVNYFLAIAEAGSLSLASRRLGIAQPALSARIRELEQSVGTSLFDRHPRGVRLTAEGALFLDHAKNIEHAFRNAEKAFLSPVERSCVVSLGVTPAIAVSILPTLLDVNANEEVRLEWNARQAAAPVLIDLVARGDIDAALMYHDPRVKELRSFPIATEDMAVIGLPKTLQQTSKPIPLREVSHLSLVLDQKTHLLRQIIDKAVSHEMISIHVVGEVDPLSAKRRFMQKGACTISPRSTFANDIRDGLYIARPIRVPRLTVTLYVLVARKLKDRRIDEILAAVRTSVKQIPVLKPCASPPKA